MKLLIKRAVFSTRAECATPRPAPARHAPSECPVSPLDRTDFVLFGPAHLLQVTFRAKSPRQNLENIVRTTELVRFFGSNSVHSLAARGVASTPREMRRLCLSQKTYAALLGTHRVEYGTSNLVQTKKLCPRTSHSKITERRLTPSPFLFPPRRPRSRAPRHRVARRHAISSPFWASPTPPSPPSRARNKTDRSGISALCESNQHHFL